MINEPETKQIDESSTIRDNQPTARRRRRWENEDEFNERQSLAQAAQHTSLEDELRMIAQSSAADLEPPSHSIEIAPVEINISKSKWDDEEDLYVMSILWRFSFPKSICFVF